MSGDASIAQLNASDALFLDFDGTLAGLQDDPETVWLPPGIDQLLIDCADKLGGALAILSGRDVEDLSKRVPAGLWRFGNHGLRAAQPGAMAAPTPVEAPKGLSQRVSEAISAYPGVRLEDKGAVIAIHYRAAPQARNKLGQELEKALSGFDGYKLQHGKMVFEAKPLAANKGRCLTKALLEPPFKGRRPVMIGDDTTDEDAFAAAQMAGGLGIKVGTGETIADSRLSGVAAVHTFLKGFLSQ